MSKNIKRYITSGKFCDLQATDRAYEGYVIGWGYAYLHTVVINPPNLNGYSRVGRVDHNENHFRVLHRQVVDDSPEMVEESYGVNHKGRAVFYTVKRGDTLTSIAREHGATADALAVWNRLDVSLPIRVGQKVIVNEDFVKDCFSDKRDTITRPAAAPPPVIRMAPVYRTAERYKGHAKHAPASFVREQRAAVDALAVRNRLDVSPSARAGQRPTVNEHFVKDYFSGRRDTVASPATVPPPPPPVTNEIDFHETLEKYNEYVKNVNSLADPTIELLRRFTRDEIVWLVKAGKVSGGVGWGNVLIDGYLAFDAYENGAPWGKHALNTFIGAVGTMGWYGSGAAVAAGAYVSAAEYLIKFRTWVETDFQQMMIRKTTGKF